MYFEHQSRPQGLSPVGLTDAGLVGGDGSTFMRMRKNVSGIDELACDEDRERLLALMSIAANRPVAAAEVLPHIEAAAAHWQRGDKALANIRLLFGKFPKVSDRTSSARLSLAEHLLDNGWAPRSLLIELGLAPPALVDKYNPRHVPAGNGPRSGQFDFRSASSPAPSGAITVAGGDEEFEERDLLGEATPKEEVEHGHPVTPETGVPVAGGPGGAPPAQSLPAGIGPRPYAGRSIPAGLSFKPNSGQQWEINAIGGKQGAIPAEVQTPELGPEISLEIISLLMP